MAKETLNKKKLYKVKDKLVSAYADHFDQDLLDRASKTKAGKVNKSRNYMFAIIANTVVDGKGSKLHDRYKAETADSIIGLAIYGLCHKQGKASLKVSL